MWILPKNLVLPVLNGSTATVEMLSDLNEQSQACSQSLSVRGTPSSLRTWSAKWKRDSWTRFLSGRMLQTSPANLSAISNWISSQLPTPAKGSATPESGSESKTIDISGPIADTLFRELDLDGSGLKTSKDTFRLDSPQSLPTWKKMVIQRRGEYSARLKSARLTSGKECLSWPSASTRDFKGDRRALKDGQNISDTTGTSFGLDLNQAVKMWPTSSTRDYKDTPGMSTERDGNPEGRVDQLPRKVYAEEMSGPPAPANPNTDGSRRESWGTPDCSDRRSMNSKQQGLSNQVKTESWRTPSSSECNGGQASPEEMTEAGRTVKLRYQVEGAKIGAQTTVKLNPLWVCTLMGVPVKWVRP